MFLAAPVCVCVCVSCQFTPDINPTHAVKVRSVLVSWW